MTHSRVRKRHRQPRPRVAASRARPLVLLLAAGAGAAGAAGAKDPAGREAADGCAFYIAESAVHPGRLGVFSGRPVPAGAALPVADDDVGANRTDGVGRDGLQEELLLVLPLVDANRNEWSPWHDYARDYAPRPLVELLLAEAPHLAQQAHRTDLLVTGLSAFAVCSFHFANVRPPWQGYPDGDDPDDADGDDDGGDAGDRPRRDWLSLHYANVTRRDATFGSVAPHHRIARGRPFTATADLRPGEELVLPCDPRHDDRHVATAVRPKVLDPVALRRQAGTVCLPGALRIAPSRIPGAGRGAFARRAAPRGSVLERSPVLHLDRSQAEVVHQEPYADSPGYLAALRTRRQHGIRYTSRVRARQQLLNHCLAANGTSALLLPLVPAVARLNDFRDYSNGGDGSWNAHRAPNARLQWSSGAAEARAPTARGADHLQALRPMELFAVPFAQDTELLVVEVVALRDIQAGEEVVLDYGEEWRAAFEAHLNRYRQSKMDADYDDQDAQEFSLQHAKDLIRTMEEQETNPYPASLQTVCYFQLVHGDRYDPNDPNDYVEWTVVHDACLRPCDILQRTTSGRGRNSKVRYEVLVHELDNLATPYHCRFSTDQQRVESVRVLQLPASRVRVVETKLASDQLLETAFRHPVGVPDGFFPSAWASKDPNPTGDFMVPDDLGPGKLEPIRWKQDGSLVTPNAYLLGIPDRVRQGLLDYCNRTGIIDVLRHVTVEGNGLEPDNEMFLTINGERWYLQRPGKNWFSDLHWLSPADHPAHEDYLQALGISGFDEMLRSIGEYLKLDSLVAFQVTFIAVSQAIRGYVHYDVTLTQAKTFNIIIPLVLADDTGPELDLQQWPPRTDGSRPIGRQKYRYGLAALMGDDAYHATSSVDYRIQKEMRLAATVYVADVNEINVDRIQDQYTQAFPPRDSRLLLSWAGRHWKRGDPSRRLPDPSENHILIRNWTQSQKKSAHRSIRIGRDSTVHSPVLETETDDGAEGTDYDDEEEEEL